MQRPRPITIAGQQVGPGQRPFVIGEVSGNHNGSLERALDLIDAIAESGAQAVKFQTYTADTLTIRSDEPPFRVDAGHGLWGGRQLYDLYEEAHTPWEWHEPMFARARERGLIPFSSPFDKTAIELLESLDAPCYKIASAELVDLPLIRNVAATGKPMIISSGMATLGEIDAAITAARQGGCQEIVLLACTAAYPASPDDARLLSVPTLEQAFGIPIGLSDHTPGIGVVGGRRRPRCLRPREARDPAPRRRWGRLRLLARAGGARRPRHGDRCGPARRVPRAVRTHGRREGSAGPAPLPLRRRGRRRGRPRHEHERPLDPPVGRARAGHDGDGLRPEVRPRRPSRDGPELGPPQRASLR